MGDKAIGWGALRWMTCSEEIVTVTYQQYDLWSEHVARICLDLCGKSFIIYFLLFTFYILSDAFIQSDLGYTFFVSTCVPWESNPQPLRC